MTVANVIVCHLVEKFESTQIHFLGIMRLCKCNNAALHYLNK